VTENGQTTIPQEVRAALGVAPGRRLQWEVCNDGSAIVRPVPSVMELAGCLKSEMPFTSIQEETEAATTAWEDESLKPKRR